MQNTVYERKQNGEGFFSLPAVTYSRFGNCPANGLVTEQPQYSVVVCIFSTSQNTEISLIPNGLRLIYTCSLLLALPCIFHIARHTFITLMCRLGVSKEDVIIATAHTDTTMIDDVYLHETVNDKGTRLINSLKKIKGSTLFKIEEANNMVDTTMNEEETVKKPISTASVTNNITFDTLLDTQFFASKINKAVELQSQVGHLKDGKLCSYDNEITSLISEIEKFSQSSTSDSDVAKQYVKQLSVGKQSDLYDSFREMIIKCVKIGISKDAIMQFINKALEIGLLDKERFTNIKEITTALLDKRNQG